MSSSWSKARALALVALSLAASACDETGDAPAGPTFTGPRGLFADQTIRAAGADRNYTVMVPEASDPDGGFSVVFAFHGSGGTGARLRAGAGLALEEAASGAAIVVYPDGANGSWDLDGPTPTNRDYAFFDAVLAAIKGNYRVDPRRVFAVGFSNGAYFANQLACRRGDVLRAVATHAGGGPYGVSGDTYDAQGELVCPGPPVAALVVHGEADGTVAITEGQKSRDHWRRVNGCVEASDPTDPAPCVQYKECAPERPVVWCAVPGLGHSIWPEHGASATWAFFKSFR